MTRMKITRKTTLRFRDTLSYLTQKGEVKPVLVFRSLSPKYVIERDGECFLVLNGDRCATFGLLYPLDERFDDIEGVEVKIPTAAAAS